MKFLQGITEFYMKDTLNNAYTEEAFNKQKWFLQIQYGERGIIYDPGRVVMEHWYYTISVFFKQSHF